MPPPEVETLTDLDSPTIVELTEEDEDPDATHIVSQSDLIHSQITGEAIKALCGKWWVPKRNPDDYPMCQGCLEIFKSM